MITQDGYLDWAERIAPGYAVDKVNGWANTARLYLPHSAVGYFGGFKGRIIDRPVTDPTARASTHGWIAYDGSVKQLLPFTAQCWASGSDYPNDNGIAFENEGGFQPENEPLTEGQINANVRIISDLAAWRGWRPARPTDAADKAATLYEHRECTRFGSAPTACPSGRIPWQTILERLGGDDMATDNYPGEINEHRAQVVLIEAIMTGKVRVSFDPGGLKIQTANTGAILDLPTPDWGAPN